MRQLKQVTFGPRSGVGARQSRVRQERQRGQRGQGQRGQGQRGQLGRGGFGGLASLLQNEGVQKELKLEKEQIDKATGAVQKITEGQRESFGKLRDLSQEERGAKMVELMRTSREETLKAVSDILKPEQLKRLKQIELQQAGVQAFARPDVQQALSLSSEQKEKLTMMSNDFAREQREVFTGGAEGAREKLATLRKESMTKVQAVLTEDQRKTWKEMTGEPFTVQFQFQGRRRGGDR